MEIINDVNGLFEFQDLGARTELKNKANLEQTQNLFDWNQIITKKNNIFDVKKVRNEGYHITGTTTNMYSTVLNIQKLQLEDGNYYLKDSAINNTDVKIYCQITLIDTDGHESYYNNTKITIDNSKYKRIYLSVQTGASIGQVDSIIYPILCKYEDIDAIYLPNQAAEGVSLLSRQIGEKFVEQDKKLIDLDNNRLQIVSNKDNALKINNAEEKPILNCNIIGNIFQETTPTLDNVEPFINEDILQIYKYGKNLLSWDSFSKVQQNDNAILSSIKKDAVTQSISFQTVNNNGLCGLYLRFDDDHLNFKKSLLNNHNITISVDVLADSACEFSLIFESDTYRRTTVKMIPNQKITLNLCIPNYSAISTKPQAISFYANKAESNITLSNCMIELGDKATTFEAYKESNDLVFSNYKLLSTNTIQDEININSLQNTGIYKQRLEKITLTSSDFDNLKENPAGTNIHRCALTVANKSWATSSTNYIPLCTALQYYSFAATENFPCFDIRANTIYINLGLSLEETKTALKNCADANGGISFIAAKATPIQVSLSQDEIKSFLQSTYCPNTTFLSNCLLQITYYGNNSNSYNNLLSKIEDNTLGLSLKYDKSNIENGTGKLYHKRDGMSTAVSIGTFYYTKIDNLVTLQILIPSGLPTDLGYLYCHGLPFRINDSNLYRTVTRSSTQDLIFLAVQDNHLHISMSTGKFKEDMSISTVISYLI
ncbi:MAG: hypothetical protein MSA65_03620 [Mollicutes bacterium]|nr:hypothetical protein [Mollicutes bacterium]